MKIKTTKDTWYKARSAHGQCKKCENNGAYWLEVGAYWLKQNWMSWEKNYNDFSGNYCPDHITEDMLDVINNWDGGRALKSMLLRIKPLVEKTLLEELKEDYGWEPKKDTND